MTQGTARTKKFSIKFPHDRAHLHSIRQNIQVAYRGRRYTPTTTLSFNTRNGTLYERVITVSFDAGVPPNERVFYHHAVTSVVGHCLIRRRPHRLGTVYVQRFLLGQVLDMFRQYDSAQEDSIIAVPIAPYLNDGDLHGVNVKSVSHWFLGCLKRIVPHHPVDEAELRAFEIFYRDHVERMEPLPPIEISHEFLEDKWLHGSKYTLGEKNLFHKQLDIYLESRSVNPRIFSCNSFIKRELYDEVKYARIINSRSDMFKAVVAPYIKLIEDQVYDEHFIKHHLPQWTVDRMKQIHSEYGQITETDYSSFEGSFTNKVLQRCEKMFFRWMLRNNPEIWQIVQAAYERPNHIIHSSGISLETKGTRMSGEMWTSLCNGFMNKMLMEYTMRVNGTTGDYLVEGDDGFIATVVPMDWSCVGRLGFKLKSEYVSSINDASFCGIAVNSEGKATGNVMKQLVRFGYTQDDYLVRYHTNRPKKYKRRLQEMVRAKAMSANAMFHGAPILWKVCKVCLDSTPKITPSKKCFDWWEWDTFGPSMYTDQIDEPTHADRMLFFEQTGISPAKQESIEREITRLDMSINV